MTLSIRHLLLSFLLLFLLIGQSQAKDITLAWDKNPEPEVVGYKVYYKAESSVAPLEGWGALEGDSPVVVGNLTTAKISGLMDNQTYYFAVSAINAAGVESPLSEIVASAPVPELVSPAVGEVAPQLPVTFRWNYSRFSSGTRYTLRVSKDRSFRGSRTQVAALPSDVNHRPALAGLVGLGLLGGGLAARRSRLMALLLWTAACLSLAACGGGGGAADGAASGVAVTTPGEGEIAAPSPDTLELNDLTTPFATMAELQPGTTYYWQVVAVDPQGYTYESRVGSFDTSQ